MSVRACLARRRVGAWIISVHEPRAVQTVGEGRDAARLSQLDDHGQTPTPRQRIEDVGCAKAADKIAGDKHLVHGSLAKSIKMLKEILDGRGGSGCPVSQWRRQQ